MDIDLNDFVNNSNLDLQTNNEIKTNIINTILYIYGYEINDYLLQYIDENDNEDWISTYYDKDWTMIDLLQFFREDDGNIILYSIDANFMVNQNNLTEDDIIHIIVPIYEDFKLYENEGGVRRTYDFYIRKISEIYKIIGIVMDT